MIVQTQSGQVRGTPETGSGYVFRGIPYASPPVGALRWRPPEPVPRWHGIRDAAAFGPMCPQPPAGGLAAQILPSEAESEDCLTCNIWTPGIGAEKYPVAVWIHGGGFIMGSGSWPSGSAFARDGIVLVTFNYRVGPLGFLHLDDLFDDFSGTGNLGIRDQIFLLRWVRDNIAAFGGDPDRVTVFGESAGAISVGTLLASPPAKGLFQQAITQSGAAHHARSRQTATAVTRHVCNTLGVSPGDHDALMGAPAGALVEAAFDLVVSGALESLSGSEGALGGDMVFMPVIDGDILHQRPIEAVRGGSAAGVSLLSGVNEDEWKLVVYGMGAAATASIPIPDYTRFEPGTGVAGDVLAGRYAALMPGCSDHEIYCAVQSDNVFTVPARRLADAQAGHGPVYAYLFGWRTPVMGHVLGACHGLDIPFVFDRLDEAAALVGDTPPCLLAKTMHTAWVEFIRSGRPAAPSLPDWPLYRTGERATMRFDEHSRLVFDPHCERAALWPRW